MQHARKHDSYRGRRSAANGEEDGRKIARGLRQKKRKISSDEL